MLPEPGTKIELHYPTRTDVFADSQLWRLRELIVYRIRDLVREPLTIEEYLSRPFVKRSRYLLIGKELGRWKQFYLGTTQEFHASGQLRLGLYAPDELKPRHLVSRSFDNTPKDRKELYKAVAEWSKIDFGQLTLRVFADDLRIIARPPTGTGTNFATSTDHPPGGCRKNHLR
jgi:hypothetical protein